MNIENLILLEKLSKHYDIEVTFFSNLEELGLIQITTIKSVGYIHHDQIQNVEKMIRMHHDLELNEQGIDVAYNLLEKINAHFEPYAQKREHLLNNPKEVKDVLAYGASKAKKIAAAKMEIIRDAVGLI